MGKKAVLISLAILVLLTVVNSVVGQCSMCRTSLTGSNNALFIRNFNIAVLVLLVPPVTIFCSIFFALKRYRNEPTIENTNFDKPNDRIEGN